MLEPAHIGKKDFDAYQAVIGWRLSEDVKRIAKKFAGARILHVNTTEAGGGVAQILHSYIPMARDLGIDMHWQIMNAPMEFFVVTKKFHNTMQGANIPVSKKEWGIYEAYNRQLAADIKPADWDFIMIHDPQPAAAINYLDKGSAKWVWRAHIDLSKPNPAVKKRFLPYLNNYDGSIFTLKQYVLKGLEHKHIGIIPVAIDPLTLKNQKLDQDVARGLAAGYGIDIDKPFIVQISRFDPWKDPLGVVKAWQLAKKKVPNLQLVLMGDAATDDPEGADVLAQVMAAVKGQDDIFIITDSNDQVVSALQSTASVVLQKSIREGFGLTVAEALWKGTPVIGGNVGGIPTQIKNGKNGYLVNNPKEAAKAIVELVQNPLRARRQGQWGHEYVRRNFLLPHLLRNDLKFFRSLDKRAAPNFSQLRFLRKA